MFVGEMCGKDIYETPFVQQTTYYIETTCFVMGSVLTGLADGFFRNQRSKPIAAAIRTILAITIRTTLAVDNESTINVNVVDTLPTSLYASISTLSDEIAIVTTPDISPVSALSDSPAGREPVTMPNERESPETIGFEVNESPLTRL